LKVLRGASAGKEVEVRGPRFYIGRSEECHLRANSDAISRRHCAITVNDDEVRIRDLGSRNGTYVNGVRIDGDHRIQMGDQLRVGPLEFLVTHLKATKPTPAAKPAGGKPASDDEMAGLIDDWLSEADDLDRGARVFDSETREFRLDETDRIDLKTAANVSGNAPPAESTSANKAAKAGTDAGKPAAAPPDAAAPDESPAAEEEGNVDQPRASTPMTGRRGSTKNAPPKDTQEAAAQTLRKFFNRGN
jgi:pSer/pThr/pTyr-binding forkhead associated (FHA) protein